MPVPLLDLSPALAEHLGEPHLWACPKCGEHVLVFPALEVAHVCRGPVRGEPRTFWYYYQMLEDHRIRSLHLVGADDSDPLLRVEGFAPDGTRVKWEMRRENGELVYYPFDTNCSREHLLVYDDRIQKHAAIPRRELERRAVRGRHSA